MEVAVVAAVQEVLQDSGAPIKHKGRWQEEDEEKKSVKKQEEQQSNLTEILRSR